MLDQRGRRESNGQLIDTETRTIALNQGDHQAPKGQHSVALTLPGISSQTLIVSDLAISAIAVTNADLG